MKKIYFFLMLVLPLSIFAQEGETILKNKLEITVFVPKLNLPDKINAIKGYAHQLFFKGIIEAINPYQWNIKIKGNLGGKQYPRYYQFTPTSTGDKIFTIELWNNNNELVTSKSCTISVSNTASNPPSIKKILCIGDSLTASGIWVQELLRMLTESGGYPLGLNLSNIEFIGTVNKGDKIKYEGYGGKTWNWYITPTINADVDFTVSSHNKVSADLVSIWQDRNSNQWKLESVLNATTLIFSRVGHVQNAPSRGVLNHVSGATNTANINYSSVLNDSGSAVNKFWNNSTNQLDIKNYINSSSFGTVDYVISLLTWNGMSGGRKDATDHQGLINTAKVWIDKLHVQYPNCKVILLGIPLPSQNGGLAQNYGDANSGYGNIYDLNQTVFGLNLAYQKLANSPTYSSFVTFENVSAQFDSENNMPSGNKQVNLRSSKTESVGTNGVHPSIEGYYQISDVALRVLNKLLLE